MSTIRIRINTKELVERVGEEYTTIDHWSRLGLLPYEYRGRKRMYDPQICVPLCRRIRRLQAGGMPLALIKEQIKKAP